MITPQVSREDIESMALVTVGLAILSIGLTNAGVNIRDGGSVRALAGGRTVGGRGGDGFT